MSSDSDPSRTDIQIPQPVTIPDLVPVISEADLPIFPYIEVDREASGITFHSDPKTLPDYVRTPATVHADKVTSTGYTPFGDWPALVSAIRKEVSSQDDLTFDAKMTFESGVTVLIDRL
jgi:hypothetical protein